MLGNTSLPGARGGGRRVIIPYSRYLSFYSSIICTKSWRFVPSIHWRTSVCLEPVRDKDHVVQIHNTKPDSVAGGQDGTLAGRRFVYDLGSPGAQERAGRVQVVMGFGVEKALRRCIGVLLIYLYVNTHALSGLRFCLPSSSVLVI